MAAASSTKQKKNSRSDDAAPRLTPAMRQFAQCKEQYPDCVLFFRMGDFYELFYDDATLAHRVLGITLTQRTEGVPMAGVPHHSVESYLQKMIAAGHRVAVCDQVQDPKEAKGVVDRAVTRVLTPGTLVDESLLKEDAANQIAAIQFTGVGDDSAAVIAVAELSTGTFVVDDLDADAVRDELTRIGPTELTYVETADGTTPPRVESLRATLGCALTPRPAWSFRISDAGDLLRDHFSLRTLQGLGLGDDDAIIGPAGALLRYLQETQAPSSIDGDENDAARGLAHLRPPRRLATNESLTIDAASLRSLEIERTMRTGSTDGSLLSVFDQCATSMGRRLLRQWLCYPLRDKAKIIARQIAVAEYASDRDLADDVVEHLGRVQDVARISGRIAIGRCSPRDLTALGKSVNQLSKISELLDGVDAFAAHAQELTRLADELLPLAQTIAKRCVDDPPAHMREGGLFRDGVDSELDEARGLQRDAAAWLAAYQKRLIEETDIPSLKVGFNKVFGYYIEITHAHRDKAPDNLTRKQTLKNAERYITPELKEFEEKVTTAESRAVEREKILFDRLCKEAAAHVEALGRYAEIVAELDVLHCFAAVAVRNNYVRPTIVDEPVLDIKQGRHPVLDRLLAERFVPNDTRLGVNDENKSATLGLITGPNMAGKSTGIRQVALITLLAHVGSFVPAEAATIGLTDRIFTRIGASDELHAGQSTFMVEMTETANILHHATDRSLVILDEIGRGTSTLDGLSLAWAIAETLSQIGARTLFATHYHELTTLAEQYDNVTNLHVAVREWGDKVIFLYRILPGRTGRSYGVHVARIAGLPQPTIDRAKELLETLAVQHAGAPTENIDARHDSQMGLFTEYLDHPAVARLRELDLDAMTPLQAFDVLRELRAEAKPQ